MSELVERVDEQDRVVGVVDRPEAIRSNWLHRVATVVCRDPAGRVLVHQRPDTSSLFPGQYNWLVGGAAEVGESYEEAAARELTEELGVNTPVRFAFTFLCRGAISSYWLGVHEAVVEDDITPDPSEIAWHDWLPESRLRGVLPEWPFVPDCREAFARYSALREPPPDQVQHDLARNPGPLGAREELLLKIGVTRTGACGGSGRRRP